ncbi:MAG: MFS transporter [Acidimicrobiia bacterium]
MSTIPPPRNSAALVADRTFGPYFAGNLSSNIGTWFQQVTAAVVMFNLTGSTFMVGMVGVSQFLPALVLAPWTGAAADRFNRKRLLVGAQTVAAVATGLLAVVTLTLGLDRFPIAWPVLATAFVVGLVNAVSVPAQQALVPALVPTQDLDQAVALNSVTFNLARAVGPALGTVVLVAWGAGSAFAVNSFSYLLLVAGLLVIRPRPITRPKRTSIWAGFPLLRADPTLVVLLVGVLALGFGSDPVLTLTPALASKLSAPATDTAGLVGILISAFGAGAVVGTLLVARLRVRWGQVRVSIGGLTLLAAGMVGLALAPSTWTAVTALVVGGAGFLFGVTGLTTAIHLRIQEEFRGRIMALWGVAFLGSRPIAAFIDGLVADLVSPEAATLLMVLVVVACASLVQVKLGGSRGKD